MRDRLIRNTIYGTGGRILGLAVAFFLTPYILHRLGSAGYAIYAIASILTGYLSLLDLGLGTGYVKYVAEAHTRRDARGMNEVLATGFLAYSALGVFLIVGFAVFGGFVIGLLDIGAEHAVEARGAFSVAVVTLALSGAAAAFRAVLHGLQRIDVATRIGVALILPRLLAVIVTLESGAGVIGLVVVDLACFLLGSAAMAATARQLFPEFSLSPRLATRACFHKLFGYGLRLQVSRASELVNFHLDKLLLARFVGLGAVTDYELGSRLLATARSLPLLLLQAVVPAVSELDTRADAGAIARLTQRTLRYLLVSGGLVFGGVAAVAPRFMMAWLGPGHDASALVIRVLAIGYLANVASGAYTAVCQGIARTDYQMRVAALALTLNVALSVALVSTFGLPGVVVATATSLCSAYLYASYAFPALVAIAPTGLRSLHLRGGVALLVAEVTALGADLWLPVSADRAAAALTTLAVGGVFATVFAALCWRLSLFDRTDIDLVRAPAAREETRS